jgi:hypothetical protein
MSGKKRLSRHDDRPGSALSMWYLWQLVPSTEEVDGDDEAFTGEMWSYYMHQIGDGSERPDGIPDLQSPLGPVESDEGADPAV